MATRSNSSITGRFVTKAYADSHKSTTQTSNTSKPSGKGTKKK